MKFISSRKKNISENFFSYMVIDLSEVCYELVGNKVPEVFVKEKVFLKKQIILFLLLITKTTLIITIYLLG